MVVGLRYLKDTNIKKGIVRTRYGIEFIVSSVLEKMDMDLKNYIVSNMRKN